VSDLHGPARQLAASHASQAGSVQTVIVVTANRFQISKANYVKV